MEKRVQEGVFMVDFKHLPCQSLRDAKLQGILSKAPDQRNKQDLAYINKTVRGLGIFRQLLQRKTQKYRQILNAMCPYWQAREFEPGDAITITGDQAQYINILFQGQAHIFVPRDEQSLMNSIKLRNSKKRRNLLSLMEGKQKEYVPKSNMTIQQALTYIRNKGYVGDLTNPHIYLQTLKNSFKISSNPAKLKGDEKYYSCTAICLTPCVCLSIRREVTHQIAQYRQYVKKRTNIKLLLNFFKGLKYNDVVKYSAGNPAKNYEDKDEIPIDPNEYYLVAEGEVLTTVVEENPEEEVEKLELKLCPPLKKTKPICHIYQGQLIGGDGVQNLRYFSHLKTKLIHLKKRLLEKHMDQYPQLADMISDMVNVRRDFLVRAIDNSQNAVKLLKRQKKIQRVQVSERRSVNDIEVMQALKARPMKGKSHKQKIKNFEITRNDDSMSICIGPQQDPKMIRCKIITNEENEKQFFRKMGFLNQNQITRHNSELLKKKASIQNCQDLTSLKPSLSRLRQSVEIEPVCFPSMNLFSRKCALRFKCNY